MGERLQAMREEIATFEDQHGVEPGAAVSPSVSIGHLTR